MANDTHYNTKAITILDRGGGAHARSLQDFFYDDDAPSPEVLGELRLLALPTKRTSQNEPAEMLTTTARARATGASAADSLVANPDSESRLLPPPPPLPPMEPLPPPPQPPPPPPPPNKALFAELPETMRPHIAEVTPHFHSLVSFSSSYILDLSALCAFPSLPLWPPLVFAPR